MLVAVSSPVLQYVWSSCLWKLYSLVLWVFCSVWTQAIPYILSSDPTIQHNSTPVQWDRLWEESCFFLQNYGNALCGTVFAAASLGTGELRYCNRATWGCLCCKKLQRCTGNVQFWLPHPFSFGFPVPFTGWKHWSWHIGHKSCQLWTFGCCAIGISAKSLVACITCIFCPLLYSPTRSFGVQWKVTKSLFNQKNSKIQWVRFIEVFLPDIHAVATSLVFCVLHHLKIILKRTLFS